MSTCFINEDDVHKNAQLGDSKAWAALQIITQRKGFAGCFLCANVQALNCENQQLGLIQEKHNKENKYKDSTHTIVFHSAIEDKDCMVFDDKYMPQGNPNPKEKDVHKQEAGCFSAA